MKKVTIMIPTYNQPQYIEQCIESAMAQDYSNLEIIISDDSTNDKTKNIVNQKYIDDPRIMYFHNEVRLGRVGNYHHTLYEKATGDYVLNLDGDDWLINNNYITKAVNILKSDAGISCVIASIKYYYEEEKRLVDGPGYKNLLPIDDGDKFLFLNAFGKAPINHLTVLYRRQEAKNIGFYNKDIVWSDTESISRLMCHRKVGFVDEYVGVWRIHSQNESKTFYKNTPIDEIFLLEESVANFCKINNHSNSLQVQLWLNQWKYFHSKEFIAFSLKEKSFHRLYLFIMFLIRQHVLFFVGSLPKLLIEISVRGSTYLKRKYQINKRKKHIDTTGSANS